MITTRNRLKDFARTCDKIKTLTPAPSEVLITADGCTDGTVEYINSNYPEFKVTVNKTGRGSVASRAAMMNEASGELVLALDDDSYPEQVDFLRKLSDLFNKYPRLAVATFPQHTDEYPDTLAADSFGEIRTVKSFPNSGACIRVSTYRQLAGFEPLFFHMYEEPDFALQCLANDWDVLFIPSLTIRHHFSGTTRNEIQNHHFHARNEFWSVVMRCPFPYFIPLALYRCFTQFKYAVSRGPVWILNEPRWWGKALKDLRRIWKKRMPLTWSGYKKWLKAEDAF